MTITSSVIASVGVQRDGRRSVLERHTDHLVAVHDWLWLATAAENLDTALALHAGLLLDKLRDAEIAINIGEVTRDGSLASPTFQHSTMIENRAALRQAYSSATRSEAIMIGDFLNTLSDIQLQTAFSLTLVQVQTIRTNKLIPAASAAVTIRAATGA